VSGIINDYHNDFHRKEFNTLKRKERVKKRSKKVRNGYSAHLDYNVQVLTVHHSGGELHHAVHRHGQHELDVVH
jgi:hypothetical protein